MKKLGLFLFSCLFMCSSFSCGDDDSSPADPDGSTPVGGSSGSSGSSGRGGSGGASGSMSPTDGGTKTDAKVPEDAAVDAAPGDDDGGNTATDCDDDNACTVDSENQDGTCKHVAMVCEALDACHDVGTCNPATGVCSDPAKADGASCNDANACTQADSCQAGVCTGANPVVCTASDQCHNAGTCDTATGVCSNPAKDDNTTCDDANLCTQADSCQSGVCTGANPVVCTASDQCHNAGTCDTATGVCSNPPKDDNTTCDDANLCTQADTCQTGVCTGADPIVCTASDQCHNAGTCDTATGVCSNPPKDDNTACDDAVACTTPDTCQAGVCTGLNTCPTTILSEDFQSQTFPADWYRFNVDGRAPAASVSYVNDAWIVREDFANSVTDYAAFSTSWYSPAGAANDWMVTKAIALPAPGLSCTLSWNAIAYDPSYRDGYEVRVFTAAPVQATLVASSTQVFTTAAEATTWSARTADLSAYQGQTVYIAWRNNSNDQFLLVIDDIVVSCL